MFTLYKPVIITSTEDQASTSMINYLLQNELFILHDLPLAKTIKDNDIRTQYLIEKKLLPDAKIYQSAKNNNAKMLIFEDKLVNLTHLDLIIPDESILIFLSKHSSNKKIPALTSHFTGNFVDTSLFGGAPYEI